MPDYDSNLFHPPAPVAKVTLRNPINGITTSDVAMLIDSGADVTLGPKRAVDPLGLISDPDNQYELMGFDGNLSSAQAIEPDLIFLRRVFRGPVLITEEETGILGRNILNHVSLLLEGPELNWSEWRPSR